MVVEAAFADGDHAAPAHQRLELGPLFVDLVEAGRVEPGRGVHHVEPLRPVERPMRALEPDADFDDGGETGVAGAYVHSLAIVVEDVEVRVRVTVDILHRAKGYS